jgi:very-short-patch-repair endonuclease
VFDWVFNGAFNGTFSTKDKFTKYCKLPYNSKLKEKVKQLRKAGVLSEVLFWNCVKNKQLIDLVFERQKIIGNYMGTSQ